MKNIIQYNLYTSHLFYVLSTLLLSFLQNSFTGHIISAVIDLICFFIWGVVYFKSLALYKLLIKTGRPIIYPKFLKVWATFTILLYCVAMYVPAPIFSLITFFFILILVREYFKYGRIKK